LSVIGMTESSGTDTMIVSTGNELYALIVADSILDLANGWTAAEFNIFGAGNYEEAAINAGSTIVVATSVSDGNTSAPTCSNQGFSGESNSLTLGLCCPVSGASPGIIVLESNTDATSSCATLTGTSTPNLTLTGNGTIAASNQASYKLVVGNNSSQAAASVIISTQVPYGTSLVSGSSPDCTLANAAGGQYTQINCILASIAANASAAFYIDIQLPSGDLVNNTKLTFSIISQGGNLVPNDATVSITAAPPATDGPLPLWALGALGGGLYGVASRRLNRTT